MIVLSTWLIALHGLLHIRVTSSVSCPENCLCPNQTNQISCDGAGLTEVPRSVGQSIAVIDLSNNQLVMISSASMTALRNIVRLRLSNNEIEKITDGAFEVTQALQTLDLSGNNLTEVRLQAFSPIPGHYSKKMPIPGEFSNMDRYHIILDRRKYRLQLKLY